MPSYTLPLINNTGLDPAAFSIYAMGFSYESKLVMVGDGSFKSQSDGDVLSYKVGTGTGELSQITLDAATPFTSGRFYFFIAPSDLAAPKVAYTTQPVNPPNPSFPPYTIVEITVPPSGGPTLTPATLDVQTVDGFTFPLTISIGPLNVAGQQFGQPVYAAGETPVVNRAAILIAYVAFMKSAAPSGTPYLDLLYFPPPQSDAPADPPSPQSALGILNPSAFLKAADAQNQFLNLTSPLQAVFDADLATLFAATTLSIQGVASPDGASGTAIPIDTYTVTSTGNQTYPGTAVSLPALQLKGASFGNVFNIFNPAGISILTNGAGGAIVGTITTHETDPSVLTFNAPVLGLLAGMFVDGAGLGFEKQLSVTKIQSVAADNMSVTLNSSVGNPAPNSQYRFSILPQSIMFETPGQMVFANDGVFADSSVQFPSDAAAAAVLGNLENQIVSALNRGVALNQSALQPGTPGWTSAVWGDQRNWYPAGSTQNLFSLFMHTGTIQDSLIFVEPANAASWKNARGQIMGSAYGFAYDENGGPVPPAPVQQPEVPSKFDQNVPAGSTIQITFGPWSASPATETSQPQRPPIQPEIIGNEGPRDSIERPRVAGDENA